MCCFTPEIPLNVFGHSEHENLRSSLCICVCSFNTASDENSLPHRAQPNSSADDGCGTIVLINSLVPLKNMNFESSTIILIFCLLLLSLVMVPLSSSGFRVFDALAGRILLSIACGSLLPWCAISSVYWEIFEEKEEEEEMRKITQTGHRSKWKESWELK